MSENEIKFQAEFSKVQPYILLLPILMFIGGLVLAIFMNLMIIWIALIPLCLFSIYLFILNIRRKGTAIEIKNGQIIFYKEYAETIKLSDAVKAKLNVGDGSFDIYLYLCNGQKISFHPFIQKQGRKKTELLAILSQYPIKVETYSYSGI